MIIEPKLIVLAGPPCSGKSTLANELHRRTAIVNLELDSLRGRLLPESKQSESDRDTTYRAMHLIAEYLLKLGNSVILDATYARPVHDRGLRELATGAAVPLRIIQCRVSPEAAIQRFRDRIPGHFAVDLTEQRVRDLVHQYPYRNDVLTVSTEETMESCVDRIVSYL